MFFVLDENHNLIPAYDKEGVLAVLAQAIKDGSLSGISADAGFVSKLRCCVTGGTNQVAFVTQANYNELKASGSLVANCMYIITDDTTVDDINAKLDTLSREERKPSYQHTINAGDCKFTMITHYPNAYTSKFDENGDNLLLKDLYAKCGDGNKYPASGTIMLGGDNADGFYTEVYPVRDEYGKWTKIGTVKCYVEDGILKYVNSYGRIDTINFYITDIVTEV
jgi:hypothetical protein